MELIPEFTYGSGDGDGSGSGYGSGDGDGSGSGSGSGYGYGYGYGDGYGDGEKSAYLSALLKGAAESGEVAAFWRSRLDGSPANGGTGGPRCVGMVDRLESTLRLCTEGALHATLKAEDWKGERWWIVALARPVAGNDQKLGSLGRRIVRDLGRCPF